MPSPSDLLCDRTFKHHESAREGHASHLHEDLLHRGFPIYPRHLPEGQHLLHILRSQGLGLWRCSSLLPAATRML